MEKGGGKSDAAPPAARAALYAAALPAFLELRARIAAELRAEDKKDLAKAVLALRKPNTVAWGLNQLARRHPERIDELSQARVAAERAQSRTDATETRRGIADYRARLDAVLGIVEACLREAGFSPTKEQLRSAREALESAMQDPSGKGRELAEACLVREWGGGDGEEGSLLQPLVEKPTTVALAPSPLPLPAPKPRPPEEKVVDLSAERARAEARARLEKATLALRDAEAREEAARARVREAEAGLADASRVVRQAREHVEAVKRASAT